MRTVAEDKSAEANLKDSFCICVNYGRYIKVPTLELVEGLLQIEVLGEEILE